MAQQAQIGGVSTPRIVFAGTPEFALASLTALLDSGQVVVAVYTQPDRPAGRGRRVSASPVKRYAEESGITVMQPETLRDESAVADLEALQPDILIVAAYGLILPQNVLDIPTQGCVNVHASILPRWRGAAPIQAAILSDDNTTGVCLMRMTAGLDCGPVFSERVVEIGKNESAGELQDRLAALGGELLVSDLQSILSGDCTPVDQDESLATYARKIQTQDAELDWALPADELQRRVRAYNPVPGAFCFIGDGTRIKIWEASVVAGVDAAPGSFEQYDADAIVIACGHDGLRLETLQLPGKRRAAAQEFVTQIDLQ